MEKTVKFRPCDTTRTDIDCTDGEIAAAYGIMPQPDGAYAPAEAPPPRPTLPAGYRKIAEHKTGDRRNLIMAEEGSGTVNLFYAHIQDDTEHVTPDMMHAIGSAEGVAMATQHADEAVIATRHGLLHAVWRDGRYSLLGEWPVEMLIEFGLQKAGHLVDPTPLTAKTENIAKAVAQHYENTARHQATARGYMHQPFMIMYAYRMADGRHIPASQPVLMQPTMLPPRLAVDETASTDTTRTVSIDLTANSYYRLRYRIAGAPSPEWAARIQAIDIYISQQIPTYTDDSEKTHGLADFRAACGTGSLFDGRYSDTGDDYADRYIDTDALPHPCLTLQPNTALLDQALAPQTYRKIASIGYAEAYEMAEYADLPLEVHDLGDLTACETLDDTAEPVASTPVTALTTICDTLIAGTADESTAAVVTYAPGNPYAPMHRCTVAATKVTALLPAVKAPTAARYGQFPVYCITDRGIFMLRHNLQTGTFDTPTLLTDKGCDNPQAAVSAGDMAAIISGSRIYTVDGSKITDITPTLASHTADAGSLPQALRMLKGIGLRQAELSMRDMAATCSLGYDRATDTLVLSDKAAGITMLYAMGEGVWTSCGAASGGRQVLLTRAIKAFDGVTVPKRVEAVGTFPRGSVKLLLYGSDNLREWRLLGTSVTAAVTDFSHRPRRYTRVFILGSLPKDAQLLGLRLGTL